MNGQTIFIVLIFALNVWIWFLLYQTIRLRRKNMELKNENWRLRTLLGKEVD